MSKSVPGLTPCSDRDKSEEELSKGSCRTDRADHLGGRVKTKISDSMKFVPDGSELTLMSTLPTHALHSGRIFVSSTDFP